MTPPFDPRPSVEEFNKVLGALFDHFSSQGFDRTKAVEPSEVTTRPISFRREEGSPKNISRPARVNIDYCPPHSYYAHLGVPMIHIRTYNPREAEQVAEVMRRFSLTPRVLDNDPWSKMDIDAILDPYSSQTLPSDSS